MPKGKSLSVDMRKLIVDKFQSGERQSDIANQLVSYFKNNFFVQSKKRFS
jgi:cytochrome c-type biogenesis protein CcmH/NrfF